MPPGPDMFPGPGMVPGPGTFPGPGPRRGGGLRVGGIAGVIILVAGIVVAIIVVATVHSETHVNPRGPCVGGPQMGASGQPVGHGNYRFPCEDGGSTVVHIGN
jgi:hypothetical protein